MLSIQATRFAHLQSRTDVITHNSVFIFSQQWDSHNSNIP